MQAEGVVGCWDGRNKGNGEWAGYGEEMQEGHGLTCLHCLFFVVGAAAVVLLLLLLLLHRAVVSYQHMHKQLHMQGCEKTLPLLLIMNQSTHSMWRKKKG